MKKSQNGSSDGLKLIAIKTKSKVFISDNINGSGYHNSRLEYYYYDGETPTKTYKKDWLELRALPEKIEKEVPAQKINKRYELREGFQETELTPQIINESYIDEDSGYYEVKGLYKLKYELTEPTYEEVEFEINIIEELDHEFEITKEEFTCQFNLLDKIQTHPVLLATKPCKLSKEDSYRLIRAYIKENIDTRYAKITSDYDFCLSVEKIIKLSDSESYQTNINAMFSRRKPKYETRYRTERRVKIYEASPKSYQSYPIVKEFEGKDKEDLKNNIDNFMEDLIAEINEPLIDCPHCKGKGVTSDGNN